MEVLGLQTFFTCIYFARQLQNHRFANHCYISLYSSICMNVCIDVSSDNLNALVPSLAAVACNFL